MPCASRLLIARDLLTAEVTVNVRPPMSAGSNAAMPSTEAFAEFIASLRLYIGSSIFSPTRSGNLNKGSVKNWPQFMLAVSSAVVSSSSGSSRIWNTSSNDISHVF